MRLPTGWGSVMKLFSLVTVSLFHSAFARFDDEALEKMRHGYFLFEKCESHANTHSWSFAECLEYGTAAVVLLQPSVKEFMRSEHQVSTSLGGTLQHPHPISPCPCAKTMCLSGRNHQPARRRFSSFQKWKLTFSASPLIVTSLAQTRLTTLEESKSK